MIEKNMGIAIELLKDFKNRKVDFWQGKIIERIRKFLILNHFMNVSFKKDTVLRVYLPSRLRQWFSSGSSTYIYPPIDLILITGRLSMITYLHEYAHSLGYNQKDSQKFAEGVFRKVYPEKWKKLKKISKGEEEMLVRE